MLSSLDFSIETINQFLNQYFDTRQTNSKNLIHLNELVKRFSPQLDIGLCELKHNRDVGLYIKKVDDIQDLIDEEQTTPTSKATVNNFIISIKEGYDNILSELDYLKQKHEVISSSNNKSESHQVDVKGFITSIEKNYNDIRLELSLLREQNQTLHLTNNNSKLYPIDVQSFMTSIEKKYDSIFNELNQLKQKDQLLFSNNVLKNQQNSSIFSGNNFNNIPVELKHLRKYEKGYQSWYEEFFFTLIKVLPFWLKKILYKERYERIVQIGSGELVRQKIAYYIPLDFEFKGTEYDNLSLTEIKLLQKETKQGLVDYLWKEAIQGGKKKYHFVFGGIGQGKTALLVKLYAQYHRFLFDFIDNRIVVYFNIDENLETKLDIFNHQVKYIENKTGDQYETVVLLDALDEDYEANSNVSKRLSDLKKILDKYNRVVITCRTQFFDSNDHIRREIEGIFKYENCRIAYIQKFKPKQINKYLKKRYKFRSQERKIAYELIKEYCDKRDFISQPLLLSFMDLLVDKKVDNRLEIEHKTQLYQYIIDRWQEKEAIKKSNSKSNIESHKNKIYTVAHQVAINIYKRDIIKTANYENKTLEIGNALSNDELTTILTKIDTNVLETKKRSVFMRDSIGNWFFVHKSFLDFFTGHAAYQIPEFDTIFEYHKGFDPSKKKDQNSASFFYTELMWLKIKQGNTKIGGYKTLKFNISGKDYILMQNINISDIPKVKYFRQISSSQHFELKEFELEQLELLKWVRCFKNLESRIELKYVSPIDFDINQLGNMAKLNNILIWNNSKAINIREFQKFKDIKIINLANESVNNFHSIYQMNTLKQVHLMNCTVTNFNTHNEHLVLIEAASFVNIKLDSIQFISQWKNIEYLNFLHTNIQDLSPILNLNKLKEITLIDVSVDNIKVLHKLYLKENLIQLNLEYTSITDEIFQALSFIKKQISKLTFYGVVLFRQQIDILYENQLLYLNPQQWSNNYNSPSSERFSFDSIVKLRRISHDIMQNICIMFENRYHYVAMNWRIEWIIQLEAPNKQFTRVSISQLSIYQFETIIMAWYVINDFEVLNNFKRLKQIYVSYVPNEYQLQAVFNKKEERKSLCIAYTQGYDLDLAPLKNLYFEEFEIREHSGKLFNLEVLQSCSIDILTFNTMPLIELGYITNIQTLREIHIHNIPNINNLLQFLIKAMYPVSMFMNNQGKINMSSVISGKGICMPNCGIQSQHLPIFEVCGKTDINKNEYGAYGTISMLNLHNNKLTDTSNFKKLQPIFRDKATIKLDNNPINEIISFDNYKLDSLSLEDCQLRNISIFTNFYLKKLYLKNNPLVNINGLSTIKAITYLDLRECPNIESYECLKDLNELTDAHLTINKTHIPQIIDAFLNHKLIKNVSLQVLEDDIEEYKIALSPIKHLISEITTLSN